jgi:hypothetical protein
MIQKTVVGGGGDDVDAHGQCFSVRFSELDLLCCSSANGDAASCRLVSMSISTFVSINITTFFCSIFILLVSVRYQSKRQHDAAA